MKLGACHVETPFIELGQLSTALYFGYFVLIVPAISLIENTLMDLSLVDSNTFNKRLKLTNTNKFNGGSKI
jgi:ubiquinol-cytochrome c reductase cytochrome b subunit